MSAYGQFSLVVKSTLDYLAKQVADSKGLPFIDLASPEFDTAVTGSDQPAICWEFADLREDPIDPLWTVSFEIGAMTFLDPAQYVSLDIVGAIADAFRQGTIFVVKDYSGVNMPTQVLGRGFITSSMITPQQSDKITGIRFVSVTARITRTG